VTTGTSGAGQTERQKGNLAKGKNQKKEVTMQPFREGLTKKRVAVSRKPNYGAKK